MSIGVVSRKMTLLDIFDLPLTEYFKHPEDQLNKIEHYKLLVKITSEALDHFCSKKFTSLDALVGENGCQLRGWRIWELAEAYHTQHLFSSKIQRMVENVRNVNRQLDTITEATKSFLNSWERIKLACRKIKSLRIPPETLDADEIKSLSDQIAHLIHVNNYKIIKELFDNLIIDQDLEFLIYSYVLRITRDWEKGGYDELGYPIKQTSNHHLLIEKYKCSKGIAQKIILVSQRHLAQLSLNYVRRIAEMASHSVLQSRLSDPFIAYNEHKVPCGPCYYEFYALSIHAKRICMPFLVTFRYIDKSKTVQKIAWLFKNLSFNPVIPFDKDFEKPVIVLEAISDTPEDKKNPEEKALLAIQKHGLEKIMLSFAAQHVQYPDGMKSKPLVPDSDSDLNVLKAFADEHGFSYKNPTVFLLKHIYCDILANHLDWLGKKSPWKPIKPETTSNREILT